MSSSILNIALIGNPNSGKTSLFNKLSGLNQKVSNLPGTSVTIKKATWRRKEAEHGITDLPGIYSLLPSSEEEKIAANEIINEAHNYDLFLFTLDATSLRRSLFLYSQIANLGRPILVVLTMTDVAEKMGLKIDTTQLAADLGVVIVDVNTRTGKGISQLSDQIDNKAYGYHNVLSTQKEWEENFEYAAQDRYKLIDPLVHKVQTKSKVDPLKFTKKVDRVITHPVWGFLVFAVIMFAVFQAVFGLAEYPMGWIDQAFVFLSNFFKSALPNNWVRDIVVNGIMPGISGVLIFLPQIILLFACLSILEETGYMSRVSFISDKVMRKVGLNGRSVIPMIGGLACAVPSIMACRTIPNKKERILSMLVLPLMSCSARLPVYTLLIALVVPEESQAGIFNMRGIILFVMYVFGFVATMGVAFIISIFIKNKEKTFYLTDMPLYRIPQIKSVWSIVYNKAGVFIKETGKIILIVTIVLWALASFGPKDKREGIELAYTELAQRNPDKVDSLQRIKKSELLESSYIGIIGKTIEPVLVPMGYDWKIGIGILASFAAREVFVGTMATIYSLDGEGEDSVLLKDKMASEINKNTGLPVYRTPVILSLLIFFALAMQCVSTMAVLYKETKSIRWPIIQFVIMTGLAYFLSTLVYQITS